MKKIFSLTMHNKIYNYRKLLGLTQKKLAKMVGCGSTSIVHIEKCTYHEYDIDFLDKLARAFGLELEEFLKDI